MFLSRNSLLGCMFAIGVFILSLAAPATFAATRDDLIAKLKRDVNIIPSLPEAERAACRARLETLLGKYGVMYLPQDVPAVADVFVSQPLPMPLDVAYADAGYLDALAKAAVLSVQPGLEYLQAHPPISSSDGMAMESFVNKTFDSAAATMTTKLASPPLNFDRPTIERAGMQAKNALGKMAAMPYSSALKVVPDQGRVDALMAEFQKRVEASVATLEERKNDPRLSGPTVSNKALFETNACNDILNWLRKRIMDMTVDQSRDQLGQSEAVRKYQEAFSVLATIKSKLAKPIRE